MIGQITGSMSSTLSSSPQSSSSVVKKGELPYELDRLDTSIVVLSDSISSLRERLLVVMTVPSPTDDCSGKQESPQTEVGKVIREKSDRIETLARVIGDMIIRLEI